ncbi:L,D-transpeptidase family protein [Streptomyces lushanensis]|uniref:L,D-transpeptidase family protein n=1 Tax=Streptomyces lushanensis TaxID=1434255 RepID=UPI000A95E2F7|nr:L,D-transpeptidase family protein [Streptomyces lushanensis]
MPVRSLRPARSGPRPAAALPAAVLPAAALLVTGLLLTGCVGTADTADNVGSAPGGTATPGGTASEGKDTAGSADSTGRSAPEAQTVEPLEISGLGPETRAQIPQTANQAVVVRGDDIDSDRSVVMVYERDPVTGWRRASDEWPAHNAREGWTDDHVEGDLRSPIGVFDLTDAGGKLADPGSKLPYDRGRAFEAEGTGFEGESLRGTFDYVIAINYNRVPGTSPIDWTRPLGQDKGGGIWLHVDHGGPTQGCVALPRPRMKELLRTLDPAKRPVVVMGDSASLSL